MWKGAKRRYLNLRKLGAKHKEAAGFARTSKGYWRVARRLGHKAGMTNEWLANEGLIDQLQLPEADSLYFATEAIKQEWWNVKFLRITALKQTA